MALNIRDEEVNRLADKLASITRVSKTEAVRRALIHKLGGMNDRFPWPNV